VQPRRHGDVRWCGTHLRTLTPYGPGPTTPPSQVTRLEYRTAPGVKVRHKFICELRIVSNRPASNFYDTTTTQVGPVDGLGGARTKLRIQLERDFPDVSPEMGLEIKQASAVSKQSQIG